MDQDAVEKYLEQLIEIKERGNVFQAFSSGTANAIYEEATVEVATFQLRKILELLAFGFVLATGEKAISAYVSFTKYQNVKEFFFKLHKLNKNFYPQPILQEKNEQGEMIWNYPSTDEYLTSEDFDILFEHCNRVLKPYRLGAVPMSLEQCKVANQRWYKKIVRLFNAHLVHTEGSDVAYLFQMEAFDANPTCNPFRLVSENSSPKADRNKKKLRNDVSLIEHLRRQIEYLRRSCELYDAGHLDEAVRLAVTIRVLLHDTDKSKSLLRQMRVKEQVKLVTSFEKLPENFRPVSIFPLFANTDQGGTSVPFSLPKPPILITVEEWWNEIVWMQQSTLTRKKVVLDTANKEGGAHVQASAPETVRELRQGLAQISSLKINGIEISSPENYHLILIRQFAHELLNSDSLIALMNQSSE